MVLWRRKRRALSSYKLVLARRLRGMYGARPHYDVDDVLWSIRMNHLDDRYACFALAMFCTREAFDLHHAGRRDRCRYDRLRGTVQSLVPIAPRAMTSTSAAGYEVDDEIDGDDDGGWDALDLVADVAADTVNGALDHAGALTDAIGHVFDAIDLPDVD